MKLKTDNLGQYIGKLPPIDIVDGILMFEVQDHFVFDLKCYLYGHEQSNYTTCLIRLLFKADRENLYRLSEVYPAECLTVSLYKDNREFHKQLEDN